MEIEVADSCREVNFDQGGIGKLTHLSNGNCHCATKDPYQADGHNAEFFLGGSG